MTAMLKWLVVFALASLVFSAALSRLGRFGIGRLPGDLRFRVRDTEISLPFGSTALFMLLFWLIGQLI